jgi:bleomycin hydrolase
MFRSILTALIILASINLFSQDKGKFIEYENEYWNTIKSTVEQFEEGEKEIEPKFILDFEGLKDLPTDASTFEKQWHNEPLSQGWTGTCWCFSGTSFLESEIYRQNNIEIKLSEMHTVYWEYVEKARRFVKQRGDSKFAEGSQANAVTRMWKKYGAVPAEVYTGKKPMQTFHGHKKMFNEMNSFLTYVKKNNVWNEEVVITTIKNILNNYLGEPPTEFEYKGNKYTPKTFVDSYLNVKLDDFIDVMSLLQVDYWSQGVYPVPDNWWNSSRYNNVPLDKFMIALKKAIENGYTLFIGGDVSEAGYYSYAEVAVVPTFDIPSEFIDDQARQFRFSNKSTTDDHGIHLVGYKIINDEYWFLIKDSGSGARNGKNEGYYFYHEDYIKLKMMNFMAHKDAIKELMDEFNKLSKK